jgi:hypothetical protein
LIDAALRNTRRLHRRGALKTKPASASRRLPGPSSTITGAPKLPPDEIERYALSVTQIVFVGPRPPPAFIRSDARPPPVNTAPSAAVSGFSPSRQIKPPSGASQGCETARWRPPANWMFISPPPVFRMPPAPTVSLPLPEKRVYCVRWARRP